MAWRVTRQRVRAFLTVGSEQKTGAEQVVAVRGARSETAKASTQVAGAVLLLGLVVGGGILTTQISDPETPSTGPSSTPSGSGGPADGATCPEGSEPGSGPFVDLGVQAATGMRKPSLLSARDVGALVRTAKRAGAEVISTTASFRSMQPRRGAPYRYRPIDRVLNVAEERGLKVRLKLMLMPRWALDKPNGTMRQPPRSDRELGHWATFVRNVMTHVDGRVDYVEIWNEPNSQKFWTTGPDPVEFMRLLDVSTAVVREVSPDVEVVSGGLVGNDVGFLEAMVEAAERLGLNALPFDELGVHPFNGGADPTVDDPSLVFNKDPYGTYDPNFLGFKSLHDELVDAGYLKTPIYITQFGYSTEKVLDALPVADDVRAGYLVKAFDAAACTGYVSGLSWYALHPTRWDPPSWTLLDRRGAPNLTYEALVDWSKAAAS